MAASILLCCLDFKNIYNLDGGILNWHHEVIKGIPEERPELITGTEEVGDILVLALALTLEKGGFDFYTKAHEIVKDQKAAQTFQTLAHVEARHMERLYERYSQLGPAHGISDRAVEGGIGLYGGQHKNCRRIGKARKAGVNR